MIKDKTQHEDAIELAQFPTSDSIDPPSQEGASKAGLIERDYLNQISVAISLLPNIEEIFKDISKAQNLSLSDLTSIQKMLSGVNTTVSVTIPLLAIWWMLGAIAETKFFDNALDSKHNGFERFKYQALWGATIQASVSSTFAIFNQAYRISRIGEKLPTYKRDRLLQDTLLSETTTNALAEEIKKLSIPEELQKRLMEKIYKSASFKNPYNGYLHSAFNSFNNAGKPNSTFELIKSFIYTRGLPNFIEDFSAGAFDKFISNSIVGGAAFTSFLQGVIYGVNDYINKDLEIPYNISIQNPERNDAIMSDFYEDIKGKLIELIPKFIGRGGARGTFEVITKALLPILFGNKDPLAMFGKSLQEGARSFSQQIGAASAEAFCSKLNSNKLSCKKAEEPKQSQEEIGELLKADKKLIQSYIKILEKAFSKDDNNAVRNLKENTLIALTNYQLLQTALIESGFYIRDKKPNYRSTKLQKVLDEYLDSMKDKFALYNSINTILGEASTAQELANLEDVKDLMKNLGQSLEDLLVYKDLFKEKVENDIINFSNLSKDLEGYKIGQHFEHEREAPHTHRREEMQNQQSKLI